MFVEDEGECVCAEGMTLIDNTCKPGKYELGSSLGKKFLGKTVI